MTADVGSIFRMTYTWIRRTRSRPASPNTDHDNQPIIPVNELHGAIGTMKLVHNPGEKP